MDEWSIKCFVCAHNTNTEHTRKVEDSILRDAKSAYASASSLKYCSTKDDAPPTKHKNGVFKFTQYCFFCGEDASDEFIKKQQKLEPRDKRLVVSFVTCPKTRTTLIEQFEKINDAKYFKAFYRICSIDDLVAVNARYHRLCSRDYYLNVQIVNPHGNPSYLDRILTHICSYIAVHDDQCQFCLVRILDTFHINEWPCLKAVTTKLKLTFESDVETRKSEDGLIISFLNTGLRKILTEHWYASKKQDRKAERARIVELAAKIILGDIRKKMYRTDTYPDASDSCDENMKNCIPETIKILLCELISKNKLEKLNKKNIAIAHAIISAARPQCFISPLLLGLSSTLNKKFGSKELLRLISAFGFGATYEQVLSLEASVVINEQEFHLSDSRSQRYR